MTPFMRSVTTVFAAGMICGISVLIGLPTDPVSRPFALTLPDPPVTPCRRQASPNTDRDCLKWTVLRQDATERDLPQHVASAPVARAQPAAPMSVASATDGAHEQIPPPPVSAHRDDVARAEPQPGAAPQTQPPRLDAPVVVAAGQDADKTPAAAARAGQRGRAELPRLMRGLRDNLNDIPVTAYASDGTRRMIVIRPTSMQDVYYYARRDDAAMERGWIRR